MNCERARDWWSLQPIRRPPIPQHQDASRATHPIDAFIRQRLHDAGMAPAPRADRATLLRRLYFDVIGLPPTHQELEAFVQDDGPRAWERQIDKLLASPHYGERWARYWLDLVRYADTSGYERDQEKPYAWKYRDWVVQAFNDDMPYDKFLIHQLAGDELPDQTEASVIATGFLRLGTWNDEPNDPADYVYDRLEDMVHATSTAFLAMTVKCARCHSHKFDPITQLDYYRMGSAFWAGPLFARDRQLLGGPTSKELGFENVLGWTDLGSAAKPLHVLKSGDRRRPLNEAIPASLSMLPDLERNFIAPPEGGSTTLRRLQLAKWMTSSENPLPARVLVNRLWQHHFGEAIVRTPNNLGFLADPPTHPQLLDWLAAELLAGKWRVKRLHKLILMSETWRQSSLHPQWQEYEERDANNRLWWRAERRRLDAETLRDKLLSSTGDLDRQVGGPPFRPSISPDALEGLSRKSSAWTPSPEAQQMRRSLYAYMKRGLLPPMLTTFDLCDSTQPCGQRAVTTAPTQALTLLNNSFIHQRAEAAARRVEAAAKTDVQRIRLLWIAAYGRPPEAPELTSAERHLQRQLAHFESQQYDASNNADHERNGGNAIVALSKERKRSLKQSLVLHLRADQGVELDDLGRVLRWSNNVNGADNAKGDDKTKGDDNASRGLATQPMAEKRPTWKAGAIGEQPALFFAGNGQFLHVEGPLLHQQPCTMIVVARDGAAPDGVGHREIISNWNGAEGNSTTSLFLGLTGKGTVRFSDHFHPRLEVSDGHQPFILSAVNGDGAAVFQNGRLLGRRANLPQRNLKTNWVIGQQGNIQGEYWRGLIAELYVFNQALSDADRQHFERNIAKRYSIDWNAAESEMANAFSSPVASNIGSGLAGPRTVQFQRIHLHRLDED